MGDVATWEKVVVAILAIGLVIWLYPSLKQSMARSKEAEKDWKGILIPLGVVVLFVVFLLATI